jgi:3-oxoacyl-[acyl-carrier-protein] synthase II
VMSIAEQVAPPTSNYSEFDPEADLWVCPEATPMAIRHALSNNIGLGGHNGAIIFKRWDGA